MARKYLALDEDLSLTTHPGLDPPSVPYSDVTLRRAFLVWAHCGGGAGGVPFRHVCNYYHRLERLESTYPLTRKAMSRHLELGLFSSRPPSSCYLEENFPHLYRKSQPHALLSKIQGFKKEESIFHLQGFENVDTTGSSNKDILESSRMVRRYCQERQISPTTFLVTFKSYLKVCDLLYSVNNLLIYLKKKAIEAEMVVRSNMPKDYDFLHIDECDVMVKNFDDDNENEVDDVKETATNEEQTDTIDEQNCVLQNDENAITELVKPLTYLQVATNSSFKGKSTKIFQEIDMNKKPNDLNKILRIKDENNVIDKIKKSFCNNKENKLDSKSNDGVQITILKRNNGQNFIKSDFDETYNNVGTMRARNLLFS